MSTLPNYDMLETSIKQCINLAPDVVIIDANMNLEKVTYELIKAIPV